MGFRLIKEYIPERRGEKEVVIEDRYLRGLANGTYYMILTVINEKGEKANSKPKIFMVLK